MNNTVILLERVRTTCKPQSKNAIAIAIGADRGNIRSMYREERYPTPMQCIEISRILRIDLGAILSYIAEDKARTEEAKKRARTHAPRLHPALGLALATAAGLMLFSYQDAHASCLKNIQSIDPAIHYAKYQGDVTLDVPNRYG